MQKQNTDLASSVLKGVERFKKMLNGDENILSVIKEDHKPLKELIAIMKDGERPLSEREQAFAEFAPLLMTHAKSEEKALYEAMKSVKALREDSFEGDTEHMVADQLCEEIKRAEDDDKRGAQIKVLAEMVEHHIKEEENDMFPEIEKNMSPEKLVALTKIYVDAQAEIIADGQDDSPHESEIEEKH